MSDGASRIVIVPPRRLSLPDPRQLWEAREVLFRFGARDVTLRYRQTALGVAWVLLQPLLTAGIFSVIFGDVAKLRSNGTPYFVFSFAGLLAWNLFYNIVSRSSTSLVSNAALVSKVFFPRILVPLATVYSALVDFAVALGMMIVLLFAYGVNPGWGVVLTPLWLIPLLCLACGVGLICATLMVPYRDVAYVVPFVLQALLWATPIAYSLSSVPHRYRVFFNLNPLSWVIQEFRWSLLGQGLPSGSKIALSFAVPALVLAFGTLVFQRMERGFADVI